MAPNSSQPVIQVSNLVRFFGRFAALRGASYDFFAGNLYVILGDNGAGKSTLLRVVAGLMQPSQGSVTVLGADSLRKVAQRVGYMGHAPLLYDELSGMENLGYFAGLYGISDAAVCRSAMQMVGLDPELQRRIGQYSQGMRQRLSLARAVLHNPDVILLDEPFSNVDVRSASDMAAILGRLRDSGKTILVITHQAAVMRDAADAFVHMSAGQIVSTTGRDNPTPAKDAGMGHPDHNPTPANDAGMGHPDNNPTPANDAGMRHPDNNPTPANDAGMRHPDNNPTPANDAGMGHPDDNPTPANDAGMGHPDHNPTPANDAGMGHPDNNPTPANDAGMGHPDNNPTPANDAGMGHPDNNPTPANDAGMGHPAATARPR